MQDVKMKLSAKAFTNDKISVDIIIPFYNHQSQVYALVESILRGTYTNKYSIILVDDGSPNTEMLTNAKGEPITLPYTKLIRLPEQSGFGAALKAGYDVSTAPYVCFLNSDCLVKHPNWLAGMGETLLKLKSSNVRLVSARSNNPLRDIPGMKCDKGDKGEDQIVNESLPLFCAMCHRDLFKRIGGFIKPYPFGGYEDDELYYRMKAQGYKQAYSGSSWIYHQGQLTVNSVCKNNPDAAKAIFETNRERCLSDIRKL